MIVAGREVFDCYLPLPPNMANPGRSIGGNWKGRHFAGKAYKEDAVLRLNARRARGGIQRMERARYLAHFLVPGRRDDDNLVAVLKFPIDSLVKAGVIPNDNPTHLRRAGVPAQTVVRPKRRKDESQNDYWHRKHSAEASYGIYLLLWPVEDTAEASPLWEAQAYVELAALVERQREAAMGRGTA